MIIQLTAKGVSKTEEILRRRAALASGIEMTLEEGNYRFAGDFNGCQAFVKELVKRGSSFAGVHAWVFEELDLKVPKTIVKRDLLASGVVSRCKNRDGSWTVSVFAKNGVTYVGTGPNLPWAENHLEPV